MDILMVAEKPTVAELIANFLSNGNYEKTYDRNNDAIFEYNGLFKGKKAHFKIASTCGHIMNLNFPYKNSWGCNPLELFTCEVVNKEEKYEGRKDEFCEGISLAKSLYHEAKCADKLVLWLDCDGEGEAICFEVINAVQKAMGMGYDNKEDRDKFIKEKVYRATFSAIEKGEIKKAMENLGKPNLSKALSVGAKHELDLRIGCAFTRYLTEHVQRERYDCIEADYEEDRYDCNEAKDKMKYISFGPCQTPTLAFCVTRHDEIVRFKRKPFWQIEVEIMLNNGRPLALEFTTNKKSQFEENVAQLYCEKIKKCGITRVIDVCEVEEKLPKKPTGLNTVEMLRYASTTLGLNPHDAMRVAQKLYINGFISYPRTETTAYPAKFDFNSVLGMLVRESEFTWTAKQILTESISYPARGMDKGDHPPITPMNNPGRGQIFIFIENRKYDAYPLWRYIAQHFLATLMRPCIYLSKTTKFEIGEEIIESNSRTMVEPGFTKILKSTALPMLEDKPNFVEGQIFKISDIKLLNEVTSPPKHLTMTELINLMVKYGIGTDASIPEHINNICVRNYVTLDEENRLIPSKLGIAIIHGLQQIDSDLIQPTIRADMEKKLALIAHGKITPENMIAQTLQIYKQKYANFERNFGKMDVLFKESFQILGIRGRPTLKCGKHCLFWEQHSVDGCSIDLDVKKVLQKMGMGKETQKKKK